MKTNSCKSEKISRRINLLQKNEIQLVSYLRLRRELQSISFSRELTFNEEKETNSIRSLSLLCSHVDLCSWTWTMYTDRFRRGREHSRRHRERAAGKHKENGPSKLWPLNALRDKLTGDSTPVSLHKGLNLPADTPGFIVHGWNCSGRAINQCARGIITLFPKPAALFSPGLSVRRLCRSRINSRTPCHRCRVASRPLIEILSTDKPAGFSPEFALDEFRALPLITPTVNNQARRKRSDANSSCQWLDRVGACVSRATSSKIIENSSGEMSLRAF